MKEKKKIFIATENSTLILLLQSEFKDLSKTTLKNYIKHEMVVVEDKIVRNTNYPVLKGNKIIVYFTNRVIPEYELEILYEDKDLIAINKPSGLLSISNSKEKDITAFRLVSSYIKENNKNAKLFVVHRLDRDTSGVLLFSKNLNLKEQLQKNWNSLVLQRKYTCVVKGKMEKEGTFKSYLTMNHFQKVYSTKNKEIGKLAITEYRLLKYKNHFSLLDVNIKTGRRNQIRVHLSENGNPILGDKKYGSTINPLGRLVLHANSITLIDPRNRRKLTIESAIPESFTNLVK